MARRACLDVVDAGSGDGPAWLVGGTAGSELTYQVRRGAATDHEVRGFVKLIGIPNDEDDSHDGD